MSKFLAGTVFCLAAGWVAAEGIGRAIVYSDDDRTERFEGCKQNGRGNFSCVVDAMLPGDSSGVPGRFASDLDKEAYSVSSAWRNGTLTQDQRNAHGDCIKESVEGALPDNNYAYGVKNQAIAGSIRSCILMKKVL